MNSRPDQRTAASIEVGCYWIMGCLNTQSGKLGTLSLKNVLGDMRKVLSKYSNGSLVMMGDCHRTAKRMVQPLGKVSTECVVLEPER